MKTYNISEIDNLLTKYYNGESTLADEQYLVEYFTTSQDIPDRLHIDRDLFIALNYSEQSEIAIPDNLEQDILNKIDEISIVKEMSPRRFDFRLLIGIAASLVVIIGLGWHFMEAPLRSNEVTDPELAYVETAKALNLLSQKLNKANNCLIQTQNTINNINNEINSILK